MSDRPRILVVAATARELADGRGWLTLQCGVGPVEAAAATAVALARLRPAAILHVGIAGARRSSGLPPLSVVVGTESRYCDLEVPEAWAPRTVAAAPTLVRAARRALPHARALPIGTSARVGGSTGCDVEAMEGFGVLRAAELAGVAAVEVRVVSNAIEEQDRALWRFDDAFAAIHNAIPPLVGEMLRSLADA